MSNKKFVVTHSDYVRVNPEEFRLERTSKVFSDTSSIGDILEWLRSMGVKQPRITGVDFSDLDE